MKTGDLVEVNGKRGTLLRNPYGRAWVVKMDDEGEVGAQERNIRLLALPLELAAAPEIAPETPTLSSQGTATPVAGGVAPGPSSLGTVIPASGPGTVS